MGRPRKNQTLTTLETLDPKAVTSEQEEVSGLVDQKLVGDIIYENDQSGSTKLKTLELKSVAVSVLRHPVTQNWMLVQIPFDFATNTFGEMTIVEQNTDRSEIQYRFRVVTGDTFFSVLQ